MGNGFRYLRCFIMTFALCSITAWGKPIQLKQGHPVRYTVQPGDTLWGIAEQFLEDPLQWQKLWAANPHIEDPYKLYAGEILVLENINGQPQLNIEGGGTVKLVPTVRSTPLKEAIPTIPVATIRPFLNHSTVVLDPNTIATAPIIVGAAGKHIAVGNNNLIYAAHALPLKEQLYAIYRPNHAYIDSPSQQVLGYAATFIGTAQTLNKDNPATLKILSANREIHGGDRLFPTQKTALSYDFIPNIPHHMLTGEIIDVLDGLTEIGQYQSVVINRGTMDNIAIGNILLVYNRGETVKNPFTMKKKGKNTLLMLPDEEAGEMLVFRTFPRVSFGLILRATQALHVHDPVTVPQDI